jgi:hypothetical protein
MDVFFYDLYGAILLVLSFFWDLISFLFVLDRVCHCFLLRRCLFSLFFFLDKAWVCIPSHFILLFIHDLWNTDPKNEYAVLIRVFIFSLQLPGPFS